MNCYDFDKTIYKKDSSIKFYFFCLRKNPFLFFHFIKICFFCLLHFAKIINTKFFKEKFFSFMKNFNNINDLVLDFWEKEKQNINPWYKAIMKETDVICSASPKFLIAPIFQKINPSALVICSNINPSTGKFEGEGILGENCKGDNKVERIKLLGIQQFENTYTDSLSDFPLYDISQNKFFVVDGKIYEFGKQKINLQTKIKNYIKLLRVKHYLKNCLIFLPLFFNAHLSLTAITKAIIAVVSFCFISSCVYIINDLKDVNNDRKHSTKRKRPLASYMVKPIEAIILLIIMFCIGSLLNIYVSQTNIFGYLLIYGYLIINILYSFILKNLPIIDVFILAICYLIRLYYGGVILDINISNWLFLTVLSASLYMGLGKRRNELTQQNDSTRKVNRFYTYNFLDKNMYTAMTMTLIFYALWAIDSSLIHNEFCLFISIPMVFFIMMKYSHIVESDSDGDPINVLLKDWTLILFVLIYIITLIFAVYIK